MCSLETGPWQSARVTSASAAARLPFGDDIYLCPAQFFAARFRSVRPRPFPLIQRSQVARRACRGCLAGRPDIIVTLNQRQVRAKILVANLHALDDSAWPESLPVTYEAPPDNYHKVVRLHGTTESLPLTLRSAAHNLETKRCLYGTWTKQDSLPQKKIPAILLE